MRTHLSRKMQSLLHILQVLDLFDNLKAIAMTWIRWKQADSMSDVQIQPITHNPHSVGIAKQALGEGVGVFLTRAIVSLREGVRHQTGGPSVGEALSVGVDQGQNPQSRVQGPWGHGGQQRSHGSPGVHCELRHWNCVMQRTYRYYKFQMRPPLTPIQDRPTHRHPPG